MNKRILFPLNKKLVVSGCNKRFLSNIFQRDGKTDGKNERLEQLEQNGPHYPKN